MTTRLKIDNVHKTFHSRLDPDEAFVALTEVSLDVADGEFVVIVGPSGCGKTTLLDLLAGLTRPTSGQILLDGKPITGPSLDRGVVFQQYALFPWLTAQGNIEFGLEAKGVPAKERHEIALHFLDLVGLADFARHHPNELSGGMKQRVAIARSLAYDPEVLLMDEPFAALDAQTRETLQCELLRIWQASGKTVVFITHGIDEAVFLGQRVAVMSSRPGRIKQIVTIPSEFKVGEDIRAHPEFGRLRHEIWRLLHEDAGRAREDERNELRLAFAA
ncbi:MAG: ABC transporter ATP-binding protein [Azoarcus sp.]|nr:ABC transporter ATP-binding protein [Azoarcus sp.]